MGAETYLRFALALVFVLGLIGLLAWVVRRLGFGMPVQGLRRREDRRLGMVEMMIIDGRRRLVLVRRDGVEHLLLLGQNSETVVESGIPAREEDKTTPADDGSRHR